MVRDEKAENQKSRKTEKQKMIGNGKPSPRMQVRRILGVFSDGFAMNDPDDSPSLIIGLGVDAGITAAALRAIMP